MQNALEMVFNIGLYIHSAGRRKLKDVISHTYDLLIGLPVNVYVMVDNNEPNDLNAIKDNNYYANYIVTGSYVDKYSNVIICAISQEDFKNGCEK